MSSDLENCTKIFTEGMKRIEKYKKQISALQGLYVSNREHGHTSSHFTIHNNLKYESGGCYSYVWNNEKHAKDLRDSFLNHLQNAIKEWVENQTQVLEDKIMDETWKIKLGIK